MRPFRDPCPCRRAPPPPPFNPPCACVCIHPLTHHLATQPRNQVNGGTTAQKVEFAKSLLEKDVTVDSVFSKDENIDTIGATKASSVCPCPRGWFWAVACASQGP